MSSDGKKATEPTEFGGEAGVAGPLDVLVAEARKARLPEVDARDWKKSEDALFARIDEEVRHAEALASHRGKPGVWLLLGGIAAAAAAAAVMLQPGHGGDATASAGLSAIDRSAGELSFQKGAGEVRVDGVRARAGAMAKTGESIDTRGAKAAFEAPGRVSWLLEDESRVAVKRSGGAGELAAMGSTVVLGLERGAIEAQVVPVPSGEAFAVDVDDVRVAVHGTHLRVAREGDRVTVDLTEGVVSIGNPPKMGSTYGKLVTAPAHIEFRTGSLGGMTIDHTLSAVRKAVDVESVIDESATPAPVAVAARSEAPQATTQPAPAPARAARKVLPPANPHADEFIQASLRQCAKSQASALAHPTTEVSVERHSTLTFNVGDDGYAHASPSGVVFQLSPPMPDMTQCAMKAVQAVRFVSPGERTIAIDLPASPSP